MQPCNLEDQEVLGFVVLRLFVFVFCEVVDQFLEVFIAEFDFLEFPLDVDDVAFFFLFPLRRTELEAEFPPLTFVERFFTEPVVDRFFDFFLFVVVVGVVVFFAAIEAIPRVAVNAVPHRKGAGR